jgi:inner membrane protein
MSFIVEVSNWIRSSITLKLAVIGVMVLILLIPASMIQDLIRERSQSHKQVSFDITSKWGGSQVIGGPVLSIPYKILTEKNGKVFETVSYAHFLPEKLDITGKIVPATRKRSIYKVILYNSNLVLDGMFAKPDFKLLNIPDQNILWSEAFITVGIPDLKGIRRIVNIKWNNEGFVGNPGVLSRDVVESGINSRVTVHPDSSQYVFSITLDINGSENISFAPLGKETHAKIESSWNSPSFKGAFLPEKSNITPNGFTAEWNILHLNRNYPQQWTSADKQTIEASEFGVDLILPVDHYQKSTRSAKYAVMFLFLTFLAFFVNEIISKSRIHPVQYLLIGLALIIFYTLLLSLSEYAGFNVAYAVASLLTISLITSYSFLILSRKGGIIIGSILIVLYGFLFVLLQLEEYSLLFGSLGLFVLLACAMFASRKIDWYSPLRDKKDL